jgi:hypothetical protein
MTHDRRVRVTVRHLGFFVNTRQRVKIGSLARRALTSRSKKPGPELGRVVERATGIEPAPPAWQLPSLEHLSRSARMGGPAAGRVATAA